MIVVAPVRLSFDQADSEMTNFKLFTAIPQRLKAGFESTPPAPAAWQKEPRTSLPPRSPGGVSIIT